MKFDKKKFKNDGLFFIVCTLVIVVMLLLDFLIGRSSKLEIKELTNDESIIGKLVINELMSSNKGTVTDEKGVLYDYIELYNGNDYDIDLYGYGLGDQGTVASWAFPKVTIDAHGYLLVYLSGRISEGLYVPFKAKSSGGEIITLYKPNGKVVDAVETVALDSNTVMARDAQGSWVVQTQPTPGFANNIEGHTAFMNSLLTTEEKKVVINEVLANNKGNFKNKNNEYSGYIELKNISNETVDITNYSLSNNEDVSFKWQLPSKKLSPGEIYLVYTDGENSSNGLISASFKLDGKNGEAILTNNKGKVIDKLVYNNLANGMAYVREGEDFLQNSSISPGYENDADGIEKFQKEYLDTPSSLIISEAVNSNSKYLAQNSGNYYDWIELYNNTNKSINLKDYCLTTSTNSMCMYKLPDYEIKKGEYYVIMASGDINLSNDSYKHTNFKLSDTESIYLTNAGNIVDAMFMSNIPIGYSMGKGKKYGIYYYGTPTPMKENADGTQAITSAPTASVESGIFDSSDSFKVTLSGGGKIYYTLDGSEPTSRSNVYSSPLTIKKTTVLKIASKETGKLWSEEVTYSYIVNENHTLDVMSLTIDPDDLYYVNSDTSIYSSRIAKCNIELLEQGGGGFQVNGGLKLFGGSTRSYRKKSYEVKFKKEFGDSELNYKVFDTLDNSVFQSLVLRTGSQDEFEWSDAVIIRDIVATSLVGEYTNVDVQAYKPVAMYINGKYWGLYFIREKVDENFISSHYNVQANENNSSILRIDGEVKLGTSKNYKSMINWITSNSLSNKLNYNKIKEQIDIENLCDFWIAEIFPSNYDIVNTRYFSSSLVDNGKWKFIYYDLDSAFYNVDVNYYQYYTNTAGIGYGDFPTTLLRNLMKSEEFKKTFVERLSYNMNNTWKPEIFNKRMDEVIAEIGEDEMKRNLERWNTMSYSTWLKHVDFVKNFVKKRPAYMIKQAKSYFGLTDAEVKKYFGDLL